MNAQERAIQFLQSIAIQAVQAQRAIEEGNFDAVNDLLGDIEDDIAKARDAVADADDRAQPQGGQ